MNQAVALTLVTDPYVPDISIIVDTLLLWTIYWFIAVHFFLTFNIHFSVRVVPIEADAE